MRKKVARASWERRTRSSSGVVAGWGPSSMVSATYCPRVATDATTREPDSTPASRAIGRSAAHAMRQAVAPADLIIETKCGRQPKAIPSAEPDGAGSGRRIIRNELNSPMRPARIGTSSAT